MNPLAQGLWPESLEQRCDLCRSLAVAADKIGHRLRMGDVHAALAGHQELAAKRRHGIEYRHLQAAGGRQDFSRHQAGWAATDDGDALAHSSPAAGSVSMSSA